jgi:hypothetical protein
MYARRIYADFQNLDDETRVRLNTAGTLRDLAGRELSAGDVLPLYTDDADDAGNPDPLFAAGAVEFNAAEGCWVARVAWDALRHASEGTNVPPGVNGRAAPAEHLDLGARPTGGAR